MNTYARSTSVAESLADGSISASELLQAAIDDILDPTSPNHQAPLDLCGKNWLIGHRVLVTYDTGYTHELTLRNGTILVAVRPGTSFLGSPEVGRGLRSAVVIQSAPNEILTSSGQVQTEYEGILLRVENVTFKMTSSSPQYNAGLFLDGARNAILSNVSFVDFEGEGCVGLVLSNGCEAVSWRGGLCSVCTRAAWMSDCKGASIVGVVFSAEDQTSTATTPDDTAMLIEKSYDVSLLGCRFVDHDTYPMWERLLNIADSSSGVSLLGCQFENASAHSVYLGRESSPMAAWGAVSGVRITASIFGETGSIGSGVSILNMASPASPGTGPGLALIANTFPSVVTEAHVFNVRNGSYASLFNINLVDQNL